MTASAAARRVGGSTGAAHLRPGLLDDRHDLADLGFHASSRLLIEASECRSSPFVMLRSVRRARREARETVGVLRDGACRASSA